MSKIIESLALEGNTLPVVFLRYNPNQFLVDGETCQTTKKDREAAMVKLLQDGNADIWNLGRPLSIMYLYYDQELGEPCVISNDDYDEVIRECVVL